MVLRTASPTPPARRLRRAAPWLLFGALVAQVAPLSAPARAADELPASDPSIGTYDVEGTTTDLRTGDSREIKGHVVLSLKGDVYRAASELETNFPTLGGAVRADVIGSGEGRREGGVLKGTAHTQLVLETVPGVDTAFAYIPREVGPRIVSSWTARLGKDGGLLVELTNKPEKGEKYSPTVTKLRGTRVKLPGEREKP